MLIKTHMEKWLRYYFYFGFHILPYFHFKKVARLFVVPWNRVCVFFRAGSWSFWWVFMKAQTPWSCYVLCLGEEGKKKTISLWVWKKLPQWEREWRLSGPTNMGLRKLLKGDGLIADLVAHCISQESGIPPSKEWGFLQVGWKVTNLRLKRKKI